MAATVQITATGGDVTHAFEISEDQTLAHIRQTVTAHFNELGHHGAVEISFGIIAMVDNFEGNPPNNWSIDRNLLLGIIVGTAATPILLPAAFGAVGLTSAGIAAGSAAAGMQAIGVPGALTVGAGGVGGAIAGLWAGVGFGGQQEQLDITVRHGQNQQQVIPNVGINDNLGNIITNIRNRDIHGLATVLFVFQV
ncbi:hypothetical protein BKA69DRAFT_1049615 [Paraphysoderma sedebokerense]|nr:hypothetical protein BKA69DRAFT_1049615 [Paraphysoderma sedebokerense]